jgi:hypothetical protein
MSLDHFSKSEQRSSCVACSMHKYNYKMIYNKNYFLFEVEVAGITSMAMVKLNKHLGYIFQSFILNINLDRYTQKKQFNTARIFKWDMIKAILFLYAYL